MTHPVGDPLGTPMGEVYQPRPDQTNPTQPKRTGSRYVLARVPRASRKTCGYVDNFRREVKMVTRTHQPDDAQRSDTPSSPRRGPHSHGTTEPVSEHQPGKTRAHRAAYANAATTLDRTMLDLIGHQLRQYVVARWTADDYETWSAWDCRCGFRVECEPELAPFVQRWHDETITNEAER